MPYLRKKHKPKKKAIITRDDIEKATKDFLKRGGRINKVTMSDITDGALYINAGEEFFEYDEGYYYEFE